MGLCMGVHEGTNPILGSIMALQKGDPLPVHPSGDMGMLIEDISLLMWIAF